MEAVNPFAQILTTPEPIIAQVRRTLAIDWAAVSCSEDADLDRVAQGAVRGLWDGRVKVFVPVRVLWGAREAHGVREARVAALEPGPPGVAAPVKRRSRANVVRLHDDALAFDERDVLILADDRLDWTA